MNLIGHDDVRRRLGLDGTPLSTQALLRLMGETEAAGIVPPWLNVGTDDCPRYRWFAADLDRWLLELRAWRVSTARQRAGASAGETPTGSSGRDGSASATGKTRPAPSEKRRRSGAPSKQQGNSANGGTLYDLADRLSSGSR